MYVPLLLPVNSVIMIHEVLQHVEFKGSSPDIDEAKAATAYALKHIGEALKALQEVSKEPPGGAA